MLTTEQIKAVQNIDSIIYLLKGHKDRYRIYIVSDPINHCITISIDREKDKRFIYTKLVKTDQNTYIDVINTLRNTFILYGALVSKLTKHPIKRETIYCQQQIYLENLEMNIQINNKKEELEAAKAHKKVMVPDIPQSYNLELAKGLGNNLASKTKTILFK